MITANQSLGNGSLTQFQRFGNDRNSRQSFCTKMIIADPHVDLDPQVAQLNCEGDSLIVREEIGKLEQNIFLQNKIQEATTQLGVRTVVVLSHSCAASLEAAENVASQNPLIFQSFHAEKRLADSKQHLASDVKWLLQDAPFIEHDEPHTLSILGVFYHSEDESVLLYQPDLDSFVPFRESVACC